MRRWLTIFTVAVLGIMGLNGNAFSMGQAPKNIQVAGKVTEINLKGLTVKIAPKTGDAVVFQINEKTKLTKGRKSITLMNLKKDDQVTVTYKTSWGKKVALEMAAQERVVVPQKTTPTKSKR
ncbi:MAG: hypothetical protein ABH954_03345 [Candidatus Omnitrophota bacterium]